MDRKSHQSLTSIHLDETINAAGLPEMANESQHRGIARNVHLGADLPRSFGTSRTLNGVASTYPRNGSFADDTLVKPYRSQVVNGTCS